MGFNKREYSQTECSYLRKPTKHSRCQQCDSKQNVLELVFAGLNSRTVISLCRDCRTKLKKQL